MGTVPIRVIVGGPVASVEILLDGRAVATASPPTWEAEVDLGSAIAPHEVVARALDGDRAELARARQWLNLPRPPAEVEVLLERNTHGLATAGLVSWESLTGEAPRSVRASFNGKPLPVSAEHRLKVPSYDPDQVQLLTVELEFANAVRARKDLVLGGRTGEQAETELTAVPVRPRSRRAPSVETLRGALRANGRPLTVVAVEEGAGSLIVVRDSAGARGLGSADSNRVRVVRRQGDFPLDRQSVVQLVWPRPASYPGSAIPVELFPVSRELDGGAGGLHWILTRINEAYPSVQEPKFSDAVAVAGLKAYGTFRRRAVLLILQRGVRDTSAYKPEVVRDFLKLLRVPLFVWSINASKEDLAGWTEAVDVSTDRGLRVAHQKIRDELESQRIVWTEGRFLPQDIALTDDAGPIALVP